MAQEIHVFGQTPLPNYIAAGQTLAYRNLKNSKVDDKFCISLVNQREACYLYEYNYNFLDKIVFIKVPKIRLALNLIRSGSILRINGKRDIRVLRLIESLIATNEITRVTLEFTSTFWLAKHIRELNEKIEIVYVAHDVIWQRYDRFKRNNRVFKIWFSILFNSYYRWEKNLFKNADRIVVLSEKDKNLIVSMGLSLKTRKIEVMHPETNVMLIDTKQKSRDLNKLMFIGGLHRRENLEGITWFLTSIFPEMIEQYPNIILSIYGNRTEKLLRFRNVFGDNLRLVGFVEDLNDIYSANTVSVVPLLSGAGVKIKTVEALNAGLYVLSTPIGREGIKNNDRLYTNIDKKDWCLNYKKIYGK